MCGCSMCINKKQVEKDTCVEEHLIYKNYFLCLVFVNLHVWLWKAFPGQLVMLVMFVITVIRRYLILRRHRKKIKQVQPKVVLYNWAGLPPALRVHVAFVNDVKHDSHVNAFPSRQCFPDSASLWRQPVLSWAQSSAREVPERFFGMFADKHAPYLLLCTLIPLLHARLKSLQKNSVQSRSALHYDHE